MATTTACCSTRWRAIRSGCAALPSPIRVSHRRHCATGTKLGMRGLRFHLFSDAGRPGYVRGVGLDVFEVFRPVMRDLGWVMQIFCDWRLMAELAATLRGISREMPVIVDHMLHIPAERGVSDPNFQALLRLVGEGSVHVKVSAPYRLSTQFPDYPEARAFPRRAAARQSGAAAVGHRLAASVHSARRSCRMMGICSICLMRGRRTRRCANASWSKRPKLYLEGNAKLRSFPRKRESRSGSPLSRGRTERIHAAFVHNCFEARRAPSASD